MALPFIASEVAAHRAATLNGLYAPVREIILAIDEIKAAWAGRDLDRMDVAVRRADRLVAVYIEGMER